MFDLKFGVLAPSLAEQLKEQGYSLNNSERYEKIRNSINMVRLHNIATDKESDLMYRRLYKKISNDVKKGEEP